MIYPNTKIDIILNFAYIFLEKLFKILSAFNLCLNFVYSELFVKILDRRIIIMKCVKINFIVVVGLCSY